MKRSNNKTAPAVNIKILVAILVMVFAGMFGFGCEKSADSMANDAMSNDPTKNEPMTSDAIAADVSQRLPAPKETMSREDDRGEAVFAGGCFWCVEAVFERVEGVKSVVSGYAGGWADTATYEQVSGGGTNHAESVRISYDPQKISYSELLRIFFATHHPTQKNRQGPDVGHQYRSAVFYADEHQKHVAEAYIAQLNQAGVFDKPIATTVEPLKEFYPAENYHQDFVKNHPQHPYVQQWAVPKLKKLDKQFKDELKHD